MPEPFTSGAATPAGTGEVQAAAWIRQMFSGVAPRYDLLNHLLSFSIDRSWRKALLLAMRPFAIEPEARILDLCCGTGDVLLDLLRESKATIFGADFCHPMLLAAQAKIEKSGAVNSLLEADALSLPLANNSLDAISIAFGFRNLANYEAGLLELNRVLKPSGMLAVLEFSHPPGRWTRLGYGAYSKWLLPLVGRLISGSAQAYSYLPESIRKFPQADNLLSMMERSGFTQCRYELLTGGIAALHTGLKRSRD